MLLFCFPDSTAKLGSCSQCLGRLCLLPSANRGAGYATEALDEPICVTLGPVYPDSGTLTLVNVERAGLIIRMTAFWDEDVCTCNTGHSARL